MQVCHSVFDIFLKKLTHLEKTSSSVMLLDCIEEVMTSMKLLVPWLAVLFGLCLQNSNVYDFVLSASLLNQKFSSESPTAASAPSCRKSKEYCNDCGLVKTSE